VPHAKNHMIFNINSLNYIQVYYDNKILNFLIDTGASISAIFSKFINKQLQRIDFHKNINITGIAGSARSQGSADVTFTINELTLVHNFCLIDSCDECVQGILGSDFLEKYKAIINYELSTISLSIDDSFLTLPLCSRFDTNFSIPPRCEIIKYFKTDSNDDKIVVSEQIGEGVFIAGTLVRPQNKLIPIKILNVRDTEIKIKNFIPKLISANKYEIINFAKNDKLSADRVERVLDLIDYKKNKTAEEKNALEHIIAKFADVFHLPDEPLTVTNIYKHNIQLHDNTNPIYVKPYRLPQSQKKEIQKQVERMLDDGIIEPSKSPWSSPLLVVPKKADKNGVRKWRVVIDYRMLNKCIKDDKFPLPNISEILDSLSGAMYFSHLDLSQGYYQIELDKNCREFTSFITSTGQYQLTRLPMGLKISPSVFSRAMTIAMSGLNYESCFVYLDDLIVFGKNLKNHNKNLVDVLERIRKVNLKLNPTKCEFLKKEILYLGHVISAEGVAPDPEKIKAIKNYPQPTDANATKRFVAFANYYRSFIPNFAHIAAPLNQLSRKNVPFKWTSECEEAFQSLKMKLQNPPILEYPNFSDNNIFNLKTDASGVAIGCVLSNGNGKPVAYASRTLNKAERNYCTIEKELLGIVWAVKHFRPYIYGRKFEIETDHQPLVYLFGITNPSSRLTKFRLILEEYDFTIKYITGKSNVIADALSRVDISVNDLREISEKINVMTRSRVKQLTKNDGNQGDDLSRTDHPGLVEILKRPKNATELIIIKTSEFKKLASSKKSKKFLKIYENNVIYDEVNKQLYINETESCSVSSLRESLKACLKVCILQNINEILIIKRKETAILNLLKEIKSLAKEFKSKNVNISILNDVHRIDDLATQQLILNDFHILPTGGHSGINRMYKNIKKYYIWKNLFKDVENFVNKCDDCQRYKHSIPFRTPLTLTTTASTAFEKIFLDLIGPLDSDCHGNKYALTIQCDLSKMVEAYPLENKETVTVANAFVKNFILRFGIPAEVVTDQGKEFISSVFNETCKILNIRHLKSTAYHHETLGALENSHKSLGAYLRMQVNKYDKAWSDWLPYWCFSYNTQVHTETKYSPYELVFGKRPRLPSNINEFIDPLYSFDDYPIELKYRLQTACADARENLIESKTKRKTNYDQKRSNISNQHFQKNDLVLVKNIVTSKMDEIFKGPYSVVKDEHPNIVINVNNEEVTVHKNRVKKYNS